MKFRIFLATILFCLSSLTAVAAEKDTSELDTHDPASIYLRKCVTAVHALLQSNNAEGSSVKTCEDPLLGIERNEKVTRSTIMLDKDELKSIEVWSGKQKRSYHTRMRMLNKCGCKPGTVCCCNTGGDMCCKDDFCCVWGKTGSPVCR